MPDITAITAVLNGLKAATDIAQFLRKADLSLEKAELKLQIADLASALADAKIAFAVRMMDQGGYRHILTPAEIRSRLAKLPAQMLEPLEVIQLSRMTRKKRSFPCYGMQWGSSLYLYPMEESLVEYYGRPPTPARPSRRRWIAARRGCRFPTSTRWRRPGGRWRR